MFNSTTNFGNILDNKVKEVYATAVSEVPAEFEKYSTKIVSKELYHTVVGVTGLAMAEMLTEGAIPASDVNYQGFTKTYTQAIFTKRVRYGRRADYYLFKALDERNMKKIDESVKSKIIDLKDSINHVLNYLSQSMIANGRATSFVFSSIDGMQGSSTIDTTGVDGQAAFTGFHNSEKAGMPTWSNIVVSGTANPSFSFTSLIDARKLHALKKDPRGLPLIGSNLDTLICVKDSQTHFLAKSIKATIEAGNVPSINASFALTAPTSLVDSSPTEGFQIMTVTPYSGTGNGTGMNGLTWAMVDSSMIKEKFGLQYIESMPVTMSNCIDEIGNGDLVQTATLYAVFGFGDMRGWMFSYGDSSVIS